MKLVKGKIYKLQSGATVTIRGTGSFGGVSFKTTKIMYAMCTFCSRFGVEKDAPYYLEGYFVESSSFGCYSFSNVEIIFDSHDIIGGPYTENDMTVNPMLYVFEPMTKEERSKHLKDNKDYLYKLCGIRLSDDAIDNANVGGFFEMFKATMGDIELKHEKH